MTAQTTPVKIALVDDHNLFRKGLIKLINMGDTENKYVILFEAENGKDLQDKLNKKTMPDIILMDIEMPDMDGYAAVDWLRKFHPDIKILVVSMFEKKEVLARMLKLKVNGYLTKDIEVEDIHEALDTIASGEKYYAKGLSGIMVDIIEDKNEFSEDGLNENAEITKKLSENEREFMKLACTELTYAQIAEKMSLSVKTIEGYRESLFHRLNVKNRVTLAMYAVKNGLVKL